MKYIISLSLIISCLSIIGLNNIKKSSINYQVNNDTTKITKKPVAGFFKVYEIKKLKKAYVIEVYNTKDSIGHTIVSLKSNRKCSKMDKIKVGNIYKLQLTPYFDTDTMPGDLAYPIVINGIKILIRPKGANVYTTSNLSGLCFLVSQP